MANWPGQSDAMAPISCPFTVVIDSREQAPFLFEQMRADAADEYRPITVPTITRGLKSGDYSIAELEERVASNARACRTCTARWGKVVSDLSVSLSASTNWTSPPSSVRGAGGTSSITRRSIHA